MFPPNSSKFRNNIVWISGLGWDLGDDASNNMNADPSFVNEAGKDFRLQSGSIAIDAGVTVSQVQDDIVGVPRPMGSAYDIGAYEFAGSSGDTQAPAAPANLGVE